MIPIGNRPVLWHVMKYYAHFGFTDFVLCLGYKPEAIKHFFLDVQRGDGERLRDVERRLERPSAQDRYPELDDHVRRHRPPGFHRGAPARRAPPAARRRDVSRQLRRHADRRKPAGHDRPRPAGRRDGELPGGAPELQLPRRLDERLGARSGDARRDGLRHLDQRRLLHPAPRLPRSARPRRGSGRGADPAAVAGRAGARPAPRGLLGSDGHAKGQAVAREPARERHAPWQVWDPDHVARAELAYAAPG